MTASSANNTAYADSKSHYLILDALRGVAAIMVVIFHIFEIFSGGNHLVQIINHGYLAVDFFFVLSGFVIAYAYDDRWSKMTLNDFFKRRLIRLHPMIIMGMTIGALCFYYSASPILFPQISNVPLWKLLMVMFIGYTLIPVPTSLDIRGWTEMHPLNGPAWTLFFEYIANIAYALILRRVSKTILFILAVIAAGALIHLAVTSRNGDVIGGWSLDAEQLRIGFTRLAYPFLAGLLLSRTFRPGQIKNAFLICSVLIITILSFPRIGGSENFWMNGLYDSLCIVFIFPLIVYIGASGVIRSKYMEKACKFLGDISYPIYITHYPLIYIFSAWVVNNNISLKDAIPAGVLTLASAIALAYLSLRLYDIPLRNRLSKRFLNRKLK